MASAHTLIVEPDDGRTLVLQALNAATKSIDLTIYELSDPQIMSVAPSAPAWRTCARWANATQRAAIIEQLAERGINFHTITARPASPMPENPFDLLCHLAFNAPVLTRRQRANRLRTAGRVFSPSTPRKPAKS